MSRGNSRSFLVATVGLCLFAAMSLAESAVDLNELDAYIEKARSDWKVPGLAVAIVKDGEVVFAKGYGVREVGKSEPVDDRTLFAIASNTKAFTAAALAKLVDEGKLHWTDRVIDHLPYFELSLALRHQRDESARPLVPPKRPGHVQRGSRVVRHELQPGRGDPPGPIPRSRSRASESATATRISCS